MQLNTYLLFDGTCEAAVNFYAKVLGGTVTHLMRYDGTPAMGHVPPEMRNKIIHARLRIGDLVLMASDAPPGRGNKAQGFSVSVGTDTVLEAERIFKALAENGEITMPMNKTFFAARYGQLTDQFGTPWMILCEAE